MFASSPLVDSGEGTGKALGINDDSLFAVFGVVIGTVFFLFAQWQEQQDDDEDFFDTCAAPRGPTHRSVLVTHMCMYALSLPVLTCVCVTPAPAWQVRLPPRRAHRQPQPRFAGRRRREPRLRQQAQGLWLALSFWR